MDLINCLVVDDEPIAREILETYIEQIEGLHRVASCKNALEAFNAVEKYPVDLVFLDIRMPDITGISLAKALGGKIKVIFTTAYREYAVDGFDLQAVDYLLKPISLLRFLQAVQKYRTENRKPAVPEAMIDQEDFIMIRADRKTQRVPYSDLLYIESFGDYLKVHTKEEVIITRETISNIGSRLPEELFLRIHRSFIVAFRAITSFTRETVELGEVTLTISRSYRQIVLEKLQDK